MEFFSIHNIAFTLWQYPVSYVELLGTALGFISVYLASRASIATWPTGILNELFLFMLFFQVGLYADVFLQVFFFFTTLYGWYNWKNNQSAKQITSLALRSSRAWFFVLLIAILPIGYLFSHIHDWWPALFPEPAAYPYADSFVMLGSMLATFLLAQKKMENWYCWIAVDLVATIIYWRKGIVFLSAEYLVFGLLAAYGLYHWTKSAKHA